MTSKAAVEAAFARAPAWGDSTAKAWFVVVGGARKGLKEVWALATDQPPASFHTYAAKRELRDLGFETGRE